MATAKDGVLSLAIEKGPTTPRGSQMFDDAIDHFGADDISAIEGKWVPAMPSNLNTHLIKWSGVAFLLKRLLQVLSLGRWQRDTASRMSRCRTL